MVGRAGAPGTLASVGELESCAALVTNFLDFSRSLTRAMTAPRREER